MRSLTMLTLCCIAFVLIAVPVQGQVVDSKHDLSSGSSATFVSSNMKSSDQDQVCIFCHTPHTTSTVGLLWNRTASSATYTPYKTGTTPGDASKRCLTCHDGTIAVNSILVGTSSGNTGKIDTAQVATGTILTNDHPVGVTLTVGTYYQNPTTYAQLVSGKVECTSCHDPHNTTSVTDFLRVANTNSQICTDCHKK